MIIKGMVSAIMPTYNRVNFLEQRIKELYNQTYPNWELIVVNDGSTDNTLEVLNKYSYDKRIKVITIEHSGNVTIPRNIGILNSSGEFISHTDDDCEMAKNKFEVLATILNNSNAVVSYGNRMTKWPEGIEINKTPNWQPQHSGLIDGCQFMYRRSVYDTIPLVFARRGCDFFLSRQIYFANLGEFIYVDVEVATYIWHNSNRSHDNNTKTITIPIDRYYKQYFKECDCMIINKC
jgi:glycosyltransferase involved in cell wall biosynthesis